MSVFTLKPDGPAERSNEDGIEIFRVPAKLPYWPFDGRAHNAAMKLVYHLWDNDNPLATRQFDQVLREVKPDIVSTQAITGFSAGVWRSAKRAGARVIHSARDYIALCPRATMYRSGEVCGRQCRDCAVITAGRKRLSRHVDDVVANSAYMLHAHKQAGMFPNARWSVIPPTIDVAELGHRTIAADGVVRFGFAGRISREKGPEELIDALNALPISNWRAIFAGRGDPEYIDALKAKADHRIEFPGWMKAADFYRSIDVVVAPSMWPEPAGRTVAEAYVHGLPIIASSRGGMSESVEEGVTGWIVDPGRVEDLTAALLRAADPSVRAGLDQERMTQLLAERSTQAAIASYSKLFD